MGESFGRFTSARPQDQLTARLPLLWISLAFIAGIILASALSLPWWAWFSLAVLAIGLAILLRRSSQLPFENLRAMLSRFPLLPALLIAGFLGGTRYQLALPNITPFHVAFFNDREYDVLVSGTLAEPPDYRDTYTNLRVRVENVDTGDGDLPAKGYILARVLPNVAYGYGERLRLRGRLQTPPEDEDFSYRDYLAGQGIHAYMPIAEATVLPGRVGNLVFAAMYALKEKSLASVYRLFPDPEASLLAGILLGVDTGLTRDLQEAFKNTGTAHIIAISGFNFAIISGLFVTLFTRWLGRWRGAAAALVAVLFYMLLVGANWPVVRAAGMGGLALGARQIGRRTLGLYTLALLAAGLSLINPLVLWDVGFQLSAFATLGLVLYAEPFSQFAVRILTLLKFQAGTIEQLIRPISDYILLTLAAQLMTIPIIAYHFQRLSLISFIANPFILPAQPAVMILGGLAVFLSLIIFPLGQLAALAAWPFVLYTIRMVEIFDRAPHATIYLGRSSLFWVVLAYVALFAVTFGWPQIRSGFGALTARVRNISLITALAVLFTCTILTWRAAFSEGDGRLHVTFLDVGSADAILVQTPKGRNVLINGGPSTSMLSDQLGRRLPILRRELDWLVIAATDEDQLAALPRVLERYPPEQALWTGNVQASFSSRQVDVWLADRQIPVTRAQAGQKLDLGDGAFIEVQAAGPRGSVLLIEWQNFRVVLPLGVDADTMIELEYGNTIGSADVLLLADSGFALSNPPDWFENLNPQLVVLSVAAGDKDGLPDQELLEVLEGYSLLRTDRNGWISISTDGNEMRVEAERETP